MAQNKNKMTKEEYEQFKAEYKEKRKHMYDFDPEVGKWVIRKSTIFKITAIFMLAHGLLGVVGNILAGTGANIFLLILTPLFQLIWLNLFIRGNWRFSLVLYFWAFANLIFNHSGYNSPRLAA